MTTRGYIITLSLASSVAVAGCWLFIGRIGESPQAAPMAKASATRVPSRVIAKSGPTGAEKRSAPVASRPPADRSQAVPARAANAPLPVSDKELVARAAKVEQEANHELRRLVKLLNLTEDQQDRVFQKLVERSPSWSSAVPGASFAEGGITAAGKRSPGEALAAAPGTIVTAPGTYNKKPAAAEIPADSVSPAPVATTPKVIDPMDEILALLDPVQQDALLKEEMDRAAWWAEIIPQITPPDDVPAIDGSPGQTKAYEGAEVLE